MRRDLDKRIGDLEGRAGRRDDGRRFAITDELRAAVCADPDDAAAFGRWLSGEREAVQDMSTRALKLIQAADAAREKP